MMQKNTLSNPILLQVKRELKVLTNEATKPDQLFKGGNQCRQKQFEGDACVTQWMRSTTCSYMAQKTTLH